MISRNSLEINPHLLRFANVFRNDVNDIFKIFWFCRNYGLALPLIALQYHEVKLKFTWGITGDTGGTPVVEVWVDYIYLDTDERRRFAQVSH